MAKSRYQRNVEDRNMVIIHDPSLGITNNRDGEEGADGDADDVAEERCEEVSGHRVVLYSLCEVVVHLYTPPSPKYGKQYPRPHQHDEATSQNELVVGSGAQRDPSFCFWN